MIILSNNIWCLGLASNQRALKWMVLKLSLDILLFQETMCFVTTEISILKKTLPYLIFIASDYSGSSSGMASSWSTSCSLSYSTYFHNYIMSSIFITPLLISIDLLNIYAPSTNRSLFREDLSSSTLCYHPQFFLVHMNLKWVCLLHRIKGCKNLTDIEVSLWK